jgi:CspA family cold shock protein
MPAGYIKKIMTDKGFGFIAPAGGGADVFFHQSVVMDADFARLLEGQPVSFEAEIAPGRGQRATVVRRAQDTPSATSEEAKTLEPLRRHPQSRGKKPSWRGE